MQQYIDSETGEKVTAQQLTPDYVTPVSIWAGASPVVEHDALDHELTYPALNVPTPDGVKRASLGDFVTKDRNGVFGVWKAYQFRSKFREV